MNGCACSTDCRHCFNKGSFNCFGTEGRVPVDFESSKRHVRNAEKSPYPARTGVFCPDCGDSGLLWMEGRGASYCSCLHGVALVDFADGQDVFLYETNFHEMPF